MKRLQITEAGEREMMERLQNKKRAQIPGHSGAIADLSVGGQAMVERKGGRLVVERLQIQGRATVE